MELNPVNLPLLTVLFIAMVVALTMPRFSFGASVFVTLLLSATVGVFCVLGGIL